MVVPVPLVIVVVKLGHCGSKSNFGKSSYIFNRSYISLLAFILFYRECFSEGSVLFGRNLISNYTTSSYSFSEESVYDSALTSHVNFYTMAGATVISDIGDSMHIIRNNLGDMFLDGDQTWATACSADRCISRSSGTATMILESNIIGDGKKLSLNRYNNLCYCRCLQNIPAFREDMHVCVDDLHECPLVTFISGDNHQKIPYVFLPLRGQIIFPDAEIHFNGFKRTPMCIISRVRYLSRSGWYDLRNYSFTGGDQMNFLPFKLFHDENRTFLQWLGNTELRSSMEGRLILIDLICKDRDTQLIFTPCISFRVAGVPSIKSTLIENSDEQNLSSVKEARFSSNEYFALGIATLLLALIYVASVFLYLHLKKNKLKEKSTRRNNNLRKYINMEDTNSHLFGDNQRKKLIVEEEGLIKNNPLLMKRYYPSTSNDSVSVPTSESGNRLSEENTFCSLITNNEKLNHQSNELSSIDNAKMKTISAVVHSRAITSIANPIIKKMEKIEQPKWQIFGNSQLNTFKDCYIPKCENSFQQKTSCERQQSMDTNNIEEKHPDENISIVECPEDVVQTNSRHKLYFNPAYFEPELLMAPPPAAVEFLAKIREVMTMAKRKMSMKKFLPSLTQIPEEHHSFDGSRTTSEGIKNDSLNQSIERYKHETKKNTVKQPPSSRSENLEYQANEDKDKRQIIQKWLQSIPATPEDMCEHMCKSSSCFNELKQKRRRYDENSSDVAVQPEKIHNNSLERKPQLPSYSYPLKAKPISDKQTLPPKKSETEYEHCNSFTKQQGKLNLYSALEDELNASLNLIANNSNFNSNLPLDEELTMHNAIYNIVTGSTTLSKVKARYGTQEKQSTSNNKEDELCDNIPGKYSLVSEVYVNDGYSSSEASLMSSTNSLVECDDVSKKTTSLSKKNSESSRLMIQLDDCPFFYSVENAEDFEPDTLDRKPTKDSEEALSNWPMNFIDSLERPAISLRTYGSFRQDSSPNILPMSGNLRKFGSLQEIYESRKKTDDHAKKSCHLTENDSFCSLTPQLECVLWRKDRRSPPLPPRQRYRQRKLSPPPPIPQTDAFTKVPKPPLPPRKDDLFNGIDFLKRNMSLCKNQNCVGVNYNNAFHRFPLTNENKLNVCFTNNVWTYRPEDSGYLSSSDSEKSKVFPKKEIHLNYNNKENSSNNNRNNINNSTITNNKNNNGSRPNTKQSHTINDDDEDDDDDDDDDDGSVSSCNDGNSESGAESIETNFKFYKNRGKVRENEVNDNVERLSSVIRQH